MASENSRWEKASHIAGFAALPLGLLAIFFTWQTNSREQVIYELAKRTDQREEKVFERESLADQRDQKAREREIEADARDKIVFELTRSAAEREKQALAIMAAAEAREQRAYDREEKRFAHEQRAFNREEKHAYVIQENSVKDLEASFSICKPVKIVIRNLSKYAAAIRPEIRVESLYLHQGEDTPGLGNKDVEPRMTLPSYTLAVDQVHEWAFRVHSQLGNPKQTKLDLWINGDHYAQYQFNWIESAKEYQLARPSPSNSTAHNFR